MPDKTAFRQELESLINRHSMENGSNTPDFILADFLAKTLELFDATIGLREQWYDRQPPSPRPEPVPLEPPKPAPGPEWTGDPYD